MSGAVTYKCPSCGGYLVFRPEDQRFACPYCGRAYAQDELIAEKQPVQRGQTDARSERPVTEDSSNQTTGEQIRTYHCASCGAEIVTGQTTAATRCYYCHSPVVLSDRLAGEFRPDGVLPFQIDREQAEERFRTFIRGKKFVRRAFFSRAQLEDFSGVYYPYWYGDLEGEANFEGEGTRVSVMAGPRETVTTTRFFRVERTGRILFRRLVKKGLAAADRQLSEGVHPYQLQDLKPYSGSYLSGFLAERRDVDEAQARAEMERDAAEYAGVLMRDGANYDSLTGRTDFHADKAAMRSVLLPAWVLTYRAKPGDAPYYYMMNGQTGSVCGKLPINWKKLIGAGAILGFAVFALLCLGGALLW